MIQSLLAKILRQAEIGNNKSAGEMNTNVSLQPSTTITLNIPLPVWANVTVAVVVMVVVIVVSRFYFSFVLFSMIICFALRISICVVKHHSKVENDS